MNVPAELPAFAERNRNVGRKTGRFRALLRELAQCSGKKLEISGER